MSKIVISGLMVLCRAAERRAEGLKSLLVKNPVRREREKVGVGKQGKVVELKEGREAKEGLVRVQGRRRATGF